MTFYFGKESELSLQNNEKRPTKGRPYPEICQRFSLDKADKCVKIIFTKAMDDEYKVR